MNESKTPSAFGKRLRRIRQHRGLSQTKLAELSDIERVLITNIESGKSQTMFIENAAALARALRVSIDWLVNGGPLEDEECERESELVGALV